MDLQLPNRNTPGSSSSFNTKPEAISAWVDDLPLVNTEKSRALLDDALKQINTFSMRPKVRHDALERLSAPVMSVAETMKKVFLTKPVPLSGNNLLQATQTVELYNQMATGYRILVEDLEPDDSQTSLLTLAIHHSLRYLSEVLLTNYQLYIQYPEGLWKTMNTLYALAEQHGITTHPVTDPTVSTPVQNTIGTVYKQILLLSLACPYRLRQKEMHFVYKALMDWADSTRLSRKEGSQAPGLFAINLDSDNPPSYLALAGSDAAHHHWRILDTTSMADRVRDRLDKQPGHANHSGVGDTDILQRLMLTWGVMPKRKFARHAKSAKVSLVVGFNTIHQRVAKPETGTSSKEDTIEDQHYLQDPTFDASTTFKTRPAADSGPDHVTTGEKQTQESRGESWKMANISAGGYCLLWNSIDTSCVRVGELVAIVEQGNLNEDEWQLGVVRWMKNTPAEGLELGIQMLSPRPQAVWTYPDESTARSGNRMQGILLPEIKVLGQQASLLLPTLPFRAGCVATLETAGTRENITLTRQLENTGSFAQYHFSAAANA